jgi:hypothetical protein
MLLIKDNLEVISVHAFAEVVFNKHTNEHSLIATKDVELGESLSFFTPGEIFTEPNYLTVQIANHKHITLVPRFLQYINHSCEPNIFFNTQSMQVFCIKPIKTGDELCYFYPSTEWKMARAFSCKCGAKNCLGTIKGAYDLSSETIANYHFTDYVKQMFQSKAAQNISL